MADTPASLQKVLLSLIPADGAPVGNTALRRELEQVLAAKGQSLGEADYWQVHAALLASGQVAKGQGRGGSLRRVQAATGASTESEGFDLAAQAPESGLEAPAAITKASGRSKAARGKTGTARASATDTAQILSYRHQDKRKNNPEVGMVTPHTDPEAGKTRWAYDPHLDPALNFDPARAAIEAVIDEALASGDPDQMRDALQVLKQWQQPYLNWAGKAERTSFEIDTVSLHVHERIDPASILAAVRKGMQAEGKSKGSDKALQPGLFDAPFENLPLRDAIDFYRHERGWANRLIAGDSLLVMNSLLQKESLAGQVQMIYIDPPYGIKYGSNFQPFVGKRDVKDRNDNDLTQEPEMIKAFRDTWELGIHSYLTYLRDRLLLARELLSESGSVFVQISDENVHHVREILDEVFGSKNFAADIVFVKTTGLASKGLGDRFDYLIWYAKDLRKLKYTQIFQEKSRGAGTADNYSWLRFSNGRYRGINSAEKIDETKIPQDAKIYQPADISSQGNPSFPFIFRGVEYQTTWKTTRLGLEKIGRAGRFHIATNSIRYVRFLDDYPASPITKLWEDTATGSFTEDKLYVVQTGQKAIERCILMTTDTGDLVLDPTCGSGTTAVAAEKWGRRWITCDTSRVAVTLAKQRLMTASYDYYELKYPHEGLKGGFIYKSVPHVTLKSIANNPEIDSLYEKLHPAIEAALAALNKALQGKVGEPFTVTEGGRKGETLDFGKGTALLEWEVPFEYPDSWPASARTAFDSFHHARQAMQKRMDDSIAAHADQELLYDQPAVAKNRLRITGPFTVEAVPFPSVKSLDEASGPQEADASIARTGESGRQHQWRDELLKTGIRGKGGQMLRFADLEALPSDASIRNLHVTGHLDSGERVVVSFGPEHAALEQRQVVNALAEAEHLFPHPKMIIFCAFAFDPEAAKDIDGMKGIIALKAQMNTDLLTEDLKKARASNQSFWLMGQPEVEIKPLKDGRFQVEVHGFDYFDTVKGELVSGGKGKIAMWALDTDYDERSLFPRQVFFPMAGKGEGWEKLKRNIRAELDESRLDQFHGTTSLPFAAGDNRKIAVKIVDDRGIESLKVLPLP